MLKKKTSIILIVFGALLLIALVIWVFEKRVKKIEEEINQTFIKE